jgi:hypothetical protein
MDTSDLVPLGEKILEVGNRLKDLRAQRDSILTQISVLEAELTPLLVEHAKIIAEVAGAPPPVPPVYAPPASGAPIHGSPNGLVNGPPNHPQRLGEKEVRAKVLAYLEDAEPGASARDVAEALRLDPVVVRQVMADLMRGR